MTPADAARAIRRFNAHYERARHITERASRTPRTRWTLTPKDAVR